MDDLLLFGDDSAALIAQGWAVEETLQSLPLRMHTDKYRFRATECGVNFVSFVMYPDGRVWMRDANVRRFKQQAWAVRPGRMGLADLETRTRRAMACGRIYSRH